jgi:hypothetical protein
MNMKFDGQIVTHDMAALKAYCLIQPFPKQRILDVWIEFMASYKMTKNVVKTAGTSYSLKHQVEELSKFMQKEHGWDYEYIGNEDLIIAMIHAGFNCKNANTDQAGPNYYFNLAPLTESDIFKLKMLAKITHKHIPLVDYQQSVGV